MQALELGNEPELYASYGWYHTNAGKQIPGRASSWTPQIYARDFASDRPSAAECPARRPEHRLAQWMSQLGSFLAGQRRLGLVTLHRYPLKHCTSAPVTASQLLPTASTTGLANSVARYVALAHAHGLPLRIGEMNSIACGGARGVSDTYASTLWSLDALFEMARVGVDGVNIHTAPERGQRAVRLHTRRWRLAGLRPSGLLRADDVRAGRARRRRGCCTRRHHASPG